MNGLHVETKYFEKEIGGKEQRRRITKTNTPSSSLFSEQSKWLSDFVVVVVVFVVVVVVVARLTTHFQNLILPLMTFCSLALDKGCNCLDGVTVNFQYQKSCLTIWHLLS